MRFMYGREQDSIHANGADLRMMPKLEAAGWVEPLGYSMRDYALTAAGRAIVDAASSSTEGAQDA